MEHSVKRPLAIWVTGLPGSGKSTFAAALKAELMSRGANVAVLESDVLRQILTPHPKYDEGERELFYRQMTYIGELLVAHGVSVIFDATANRRRYREEARKRIPQLLQVYVDTPLEVCMARDPKGIYRKGREGGSTTVPGAQAVYEPPENPDVVVHGSRETPESAAHRVIMKLAEMSYL